MEGDGHGEQAPEHTGPRWLVLLDQPTLPSGPARGSVFLRVSRVEDGGTRTIATFSIASPRHPGEADALVATIARLLREDETLSTEDPTSPALIERLDEIVEAAQRRVVDRTSTPGRPWRRAPSESGVHPGTGCRGEIGAETLRAAESAVRLAHQELLAAQERRARARYLLATCPTTAPPPKGAAGRPARHGGIAGEREAAERERRRADELVAERVRHLAQALERLGRVTGSEPSTASARDAAGRPHS